VHQQKGTYLDNLAAGLLKVSNLLPDGKSQLESLGLAGDVLPGEGPVQDGHWACSSTHTLSQP